MKSSVAATELQCSSAADVAQKPGAPPNPTLKATPPIIPCLFSDAGQHMQMQQRCF